MILLYIGWQNLNLLSQPNATLVPQVRKARASGEIFNYLLSRYSDILKHDHWIVVLMNAEETDSTRNSILLPSKQS